jgi:hypothetical protein
MSYIFYKSVLKELGYKIQYESISHLYGDSYAEKRSEIIEKYNPFMIDVTEENKSQGKRVTLGMLKSMGVIK